MKKIISFILMMIFGAYGLVLASHNQLGLYIHPRFFDESIAASIVALSVGVLGLLTNLKDFSKLVQKIIEQIMDTKFIFILICVILSLVVNELFALFAILILLAPLKKDTLSKNLTNIEFGFFIVAGIILAITVTTPKGLTSVTASQRSIDLNSINLTQNTIDVAQNFGKSTKSYGIGDWIASETYNPDPNYYKDKEVDVTGFVYKPSGINLQPDEFLVSRFIITCCAVDARPVGLKVKFDTTNKFNTDDWVRVTGKFDVENDDIIIKPDTVEATTAPSNPYIY